MTAATDAAPLPSPVPKARLASAGDAASPQALNLLSQALAKPARAAVTPPKPAVTALKSAVAAIRTQDYALGTRQALKALELCERWHLAWHVLAIAREKAGDLAPALTAYETALKLAVDEGPIARDLGRLAQRLGYLEIAEKLLLKALELSPDNSEASNNLACVLRDQQRYPEAVALLTACIERSPEIALYWNTLGTVLTDQGEMAQSLTFFDEALRLQPGDHKALYNRANARMALGEPREALADIDQAIPLCADAHETATMRMARALVLLLLGELEDGFDTYEVRFDPRMKDALAFATDSARWTPETDIEGRRLLVFGEQGLGDEVLFANVLPDAIRAVGPGGQLTVAVEHRLVPLFQRSFPEATVVRHRTVRHAGRLARVAALPAEAERPELHAPIGSLFRRFRRSLEDFPRTPFLAPDGEQVAHWRRTLDALGPEPKVGVLWKSLKLDGHRARYFSPFELWRPVLSTPGVRFVNLQYGDCAPELAEAAEQGFDLWTPELDLKDDLDGVAALTKALDLVIGPANATLNLAGAVGAPVWLIATPDHWPGFGSDGWPCYPSATAFPTDGFADWDGVMGRVAQALATRAGAARAA
ncbi:tetratricopeptide repeat protein [Brevundimonas lutea]|uniref:tetratricopeptide repeat-containing glycosyltransferase family protein n=1 Tax=Brevundimonas lutea TaxID=2293980 RepID=UPI000F02CDAB|nr:tetratricopeptide repeat-containing glycosyltransferase family protein [Brevundimonas lutea]